MISIAISFVIGALIGAGIVILALRPGAISVHWSIGPISYVRSGEISSLTIWRVRRMRSGKLVRWVRAA